MVRLIIFFCSLLLISSDMTYGMQSFEFVDCTQEIASSGKQCPFCSNILSSKSTLKTHIIRHNICHQCRNKTPFATKEKLYDHYTKHHTKHAKSVHKLLLDKRPQPLKEKFIKPITGLNCSICSAENFASTQGLIGHLSRAHLLCSYCHDHQEFSSSTELLEHTADNHLRVLKTVLAWHEKKLTDEEKAKYNAMPLLKNIQQDLLCPVCPITSFATAQSFCAHLNKAHIMCGYCKPPQQFDSHTQLLSHTAELHVNILRSVLYWSKEKLTAEERTQFLSQYAKKSSPHPQAIPCPLCPSATPFSSQQSFFRHLNMMHTICAYCMPAQQFPSPSQLLEHTAAEHENVLASVSSWMTNRIRSEAMKQKKILYLEPEKVAPQESPQEDTSQGTACSLNTNPVSTLPRIPSQTSDFIKWLEDNFPNQEQYSLQTSH